MDTAAVITQIRALLEQKFVEDDHYAQFFILDVRLSAHPKLEVVLDSLGSLTTDDCARLSRHLEYHIDQNNWLGEQYVIEVSSAGVGNPLTDPRQFRKNIGRLLTVKTVAGDTVEGTLTRFEDDKITLSWTAKVALPPSKKKVEQLFERTIALADVQKAIVQVTF
jgi:ribosome maturation factor RimP